MIGDLESSPPLRAVSVEVDVGFLVEPVVHRPWSWLAEIVVDICKSVTQSVPFAGSHNHGADKLTESEGVLHR
jgi:hypothetical protein